MSKEARGGEEARREILKIEVERTKEAESRKGCQKGNLKGRSSKEHGGTEGKRKQERKS